MWLHIVSILLLQLVIMYKVCIGYYNDYYNDIVSIMYNVVTICNACIILSSVIRFSIDMVHDYGNSSRKKDCSKIKWSRELLFACWNEMHGEKSCHFAGKWYIGGNIKGEKVRLLAYIAPFFATDCICLLEQCTGQYYCIWR